MGAIYAGVFAIACLSMAVTAALEYGKRRDSERYDPRHVIRQDDDRNG